MSDLYRIDEINLDRSYEYSVITTNPTASENNNSNQNRGANSIYYYNPNSGSQNNYVKSTNLDLNITDNSNEYNNASVKHQLPNNAHVPSKTSLATQYQVCSNPYGDNLLSSTLNQLDKEQLCHKSYFEKLPPEIEISVNGTETLPENSVLETENTCNTSGTETDTTDMNVKKFKKLRYLLNEIPYKSMIKMHD